MVGVTTNDAQMRLVGPDELAQHYEGRILLILHRLATWAATPDDRIDWELEAVLQDLAAASQALRDLRGESDLPF